jgi:hypothetical protein
MPEGVTTQSATYTTHTTYAMFDVRTEQISPFIDNVTGHTEFCT